MGKIKNNINIDNIFTSLLFVVTFIWFGPIEIFSANSVEMAFSFREFWYLILLEGIVIFFILAFVFSVLPEIVSKICKAVLFCITVCCYVQSMFLNGYMVVLFNTDITWDIGIKIRNLIIWIVTMVVLFVLQFKLEAFRGYTSAGLTIIQLIALISILMTTGIINEEKNGYLNSNHMLEVGKQENVIVFILDCFDTALLKEAVDKEPALLEDFDGFTWYTDSIGIHSSTFPSMPYLMAGDICHFDVPSGEYLKEAYGNGNLITDLYNENIDVAYFGYDYYLADGVKNNLSNYQRVNPPINMYRMCRYFLKMVLYRDAPYICKRRLEYDINEINTYIYKYKDEDIRKDENSIYRVCDDEWFAGKLIEKGINVSSEYDKAFRLIHLYACHRDLTNQLPYGKFALETVSEYLDKLRELELYDSTTVIITADHGCSVGGLDLSTPVSPIALVKPGDAIGNGIKTDNTPVSQANFYATVLDGFGLNYESKGVPYYAPEVKDQERYFYYTALESYDVGEYELQEYKIEGDALDMNSYVLTGRKWPIYYSMNPVSPK